MAAAQHWPSRQRVRWRIAPARRLTLTVLWQERCLEPPHWRAVLWLQLSVDVGPSGCAGAQALPETTPVLFPPGTLPETTEEDGVCRARCAALALAPPSALAHRSLQKLTLVISGMGVAWSHRQGGPHRGCSATWGICPSRCAGALFLAVDPWLLLPGAQHKVATKGGVRHGRTAALALAPARALAHCSATNKALVLCLGGALPGATAEADPTVAASHHGIGPSEWAHSQKALVRSTT